MAAAGERSLTIAHVNPERGFSGGEVQVFLLLEGLRRRGHRNFLYCLPGSRSEAEGRARGLDTRAVPMRSHLDVPAIVRIGRDLRRERVDIVHLHTGRANWLGGIAARIAGIPALTTRRMDRPVRRGWRTRFLYGRLVRHAVAISDAVAQRLREGGVPPSRTTTIPSAVDPEALRPRRGRDEVRASLGLLPEEIAALTLAALFPRKGIDVLLDAMALLARSGEASRLFVAGEGPERETLERQARALGVETRVRFLGRREDKAELLAACDLFVLPSRREGLGVAALEAMAAGRPVVASRVGGLAEAVVEGETGLLVAPEDPDALAEAIRRVAADAALRARLGAGGPARVSREFLPEQMVEAYERLYLSLSCPAP